MATTNTKHSEETEIDLVQIFRALLHRLWLLILVTVVFAALGVAATWLFITPKYSTTFTSYVNNHNSTDVLTSLNSGDLSARATLANTTAKIATSTTVLEKVARETGVEREDMQVSSSVDSSSGILTVRVIMADQTKVLPCAQNLASVLTEETARIIEGSSLQIIDSPREPSGRYSPSYSRNALLAGLIGLVICAIIVIVLELTDDTLKDVSELEATYNVPVIGSIPDMSGTSRKSGYGKSGYGYGYGYSYGSRHGDSRMKAPGIGSGNADNN